MYTRTNNKKTFINKTRLYYDYPCSVINTSPFLITFCLHCLFSSVIFISSSYISSMLNSSTGTKALLIVNRKCLSHRQTAGSGGYKNDHTTLVRSLKEGLNEARMELAPKFTLVKLTLLWTFPASHLSRKISNFSSRLLRKHISVHLSKSY